jgi:hypothetical protein
MIEIKTCKLSDTCPLCKSKNYHHDSRQEALVCDDCGWTYPDRPPLKWFWADHRIIDELRRIEEGNISSLPLTYIMVWVLRVLPNLRDVLKFYSKNKG